MKRIYRKIGLRFLKWSGWDVPDEIIRRAVTPVILTVQKITNENGVLNVERLQKQQKEKLMEYAGNYVNFKTTKVDKKGVMSVATMIVQRPDPTGSRKNDSESRSKNSTGTKTVLDAHKPNKK
jgi:hypothetical protein